MEETIEKPAAKAALNGEPKETDVKSVDSECETPTAVTNADQSAQSTSSLVEAASKVAEAVSEVVEAVTKVSEPQKQESGSGEEASAPDAEKPVEKSSTVEEKAGAGKVGELFTDDMVENIEQNYSPTESGALNLLDIPDEMFASEAKAAAETNGACKPEDAEATDKDEKSDIAEAANLFLQGKRNLLVKDFESAANILGDACSKYSTIYGDLGVECAEVYMAYGQALLEWWRMEDLNRKNNDTMDESKVDAEENGADDAPVKANGVDEPPKEAEDEPMDNQADENAVNAEEPNEDAEENGDEDEDEIESEEEVDNLQIAFETLEVAKKIYETTKDDANLAKVHSKLGEISIANGNLMYALDDLKRALELLSTAAAVDVRHKANVHFQLYIVHTMRCSFPEAEAELRVAKSTFESHQRDLERKLVAAKSSGDADAISAEIKEIKEVIRDLSEKLVECHKEKRELISAISDVIKTKQATSADMPSSSASMDAPSSSSASAVTFSPRKADVPINNISHLVRKKPKNVPEESKVEPMAEKAGEASAKSNGVEAASAETSAKRKAEDVLENEAKKNCS